MAKAPRASASVNVGVIDAALEAQPFDFSGAEAWSVLVLLDGTPVERVELPAPGSIGSPALVRASLTRRADDAVGRRRLTDDLLTRIGAAPGAAPSVPTVSVVLCTHRRPDHLARVLAALGGLDPAPSEIIVVDNAPGDQDCQDSVGAAGFRYVREDRQGLDNARNAGVRAATGEVVAFTDDDCVPSPGWLRIIPALFDDPLVGGATGPMFPYALDTPSRVHMERVASLARGFRRTTFDWQKISAVAAGAIGVGANMAFRRDVLRELGDEPFPPELDAGTPTESGGDTFVIAQVIARGHRMIYAPEMFGFHLHRSDPAALHRAVRGYGVGLSAAMSKLLLERGEGEAWRGWWWLVQQYLRTQRRRVVGRADATDARLAREYLVGGLLGPLRWRGSLRTQRQLAPASPSPMEERQSSAPGPGIAPRPAEAHALQISIVIPTYRDPDVVARCLQSLAEQTAPPGSFEVIVVDDTDPPILDATSLAVPGLQLRVLQSRGGGSSAARNLGAREARAPLLLFLDDDMVAEPELIERHLACHTEERPTAVVGAYPPWPSAPGLTAASAVIFWSDLFASMERAVSSTFVFLLSGNLSIPRSALLAVGGFELPYGREDWDLGLRWVRAGYGIAYEPDARARHAFSLPTATRIRRAELEGYSDTILVSRHPEAVGALPLVSYRPLAPGPSARRLRFAVSRRPMAQKAASTTLELLERARLRLTWQRLWNRVQSAAYIRGLERGGYEPRLEDEVVLDCDLLSGEQLKVNGPVAPTLRVTVADEELVRVRPHNGHWGPHIAEQIVDALGPAIIERVGAARGWLETDEKPSDISHRVEVITGPGGRPQDHWNAVASAAARSQSKIVALPLHGMRQDPRWLAEALVAFDGERISAAFGRAAGDDRPLQPLYLHDSASPPRFEHGDAPDYLVVRTQALRDLGGIRADAARWGELAPVMVTIQDVLAAGGLVGRRDVHGLHRVGSPVSPLEEGRAWAAAQLCRSRAPARALAKGGAGLAATLLWQLVRQRGRIDRRGIGGMSGAAQGALWGAAAARAELRTSAPSTNGKRRLSRNRVPR